MEHEFFPECVARVPVSLWGSGGWGSVRSTFRLRPQPFVTVRNRPLDCYMAVPMVSSAEGGFSRFQTSRALLRSRGRRSTSWHSDVESRFVWQVQYFCDVFGRCVAVFVAAKHFRRVHRHFASQAQHFRRVELRAFANRIGRDALATRCGFRGRRAKCQNWRKSRTKCSFCCSHVSRLESLVFLRVSKQFVMLLCVAGRGTLWHSNLFDNVSKVSNLAEVSHEMLVLLRPRVSSRVSGFPVASLCLWGKLQNISFSKVSKQVVMSFCVAGMALCDIPTCLLTCRKCQN